MKVFSFVRPWHLIALSLLLIPLVFLANRYSDIPSDRKIRKWAESALGKQTVGNSWWQTMLAQPSKGEERWEERSIREHVEHDGVDTYRYWYLYGEIYQGHRGLGGHRTRIGNVAYTESGKPEYFNEFVGDQIIVTHFWPTESSYLRRDRTY